MQVNLNELCISSDSTADQPLKDYSFSSADGMTKVYFRDLERRLIEHIREAEVVVGCVAWLTSEPILRALAGVSGGVSIVVQKEDFLRPDIGQENGWKAHLRRLYDGLHFPLERHGLLTPGRLVNSLSVCGDPAIQPVRCLGNHNRERKPAFPRMHHKFLVFCEMERGPEDEWWNMLHPHTAWTGSFNLTRNASQSLENALVLTDPRLVRAYCYEWEQLLALSEPLDWCLDWCAPEWRIGT